MAAVLSREIAMILALGLAAAEFRERKFLRSIAFVAGARRGLVGLENLYAALVGGGFHGGRKDLRLTLFLGREKNRRDHLRLRQPSLDGNRRISRGGGSLIGFAAVVSQKMRLTAADWTFLGFTALIPFLTYSVYIEAWGFTRILIFLPFLATLVAERQKSAWRRWSLRSVAIAYAIVGMIMLTGELRAATRGHGLGRATIDAVSHLVKPSSRPRPQKRRPVKMEATLPANPDSGQPGYTADRSRAFDSADRY